MALTDTSEKGLEALIVNFLTGQTENVGAGETIEPYDPEFIPGSPADFNRDYALDLVKLLQFLNTTQPSLVEEFGLASSGPSQAAFLGRLQGEITKRGVIDVLLKGVRHHHAQINLFFGTPTRGNLDAVTLFFQNVFSVTRQVQYSRANTNSVDIALFINGLPLATFELKNNLTKQNANDAVDQYRTDRDPRELLFIPGRCAVHFALDDQLIRFCTELRGKGSTFLPFDKGHNYGAGNPPNPDGLKTAYLWREILNRKSLANIIENYAGQFDGSGPGGKKFKTNLWPRYHQLDVVRKLLAEVGSNGVGRRYLIQHSAGSGKSNSIAWLAHQLISIEHKGQTAVDSVIVVTDRTLLDDQIERTIKRFASVKAIVGAADDAAQLREHIATGRKIITTTVQKFPFVAEGLIGEHRNRRFAIIIDEAHSSQGGRAAAQMNRVLGTTDSNEDETFEDQVNRLIEGRRMLANASYFAFTATPKNKTLELFGTRSPATGKFDPFHTYSMKQAIEERFILDVLASYTPYKSYYRLVKAVEADPEYDVNKAKRKLRTYVEGHSFAIRQKAEIMVDHFYDHVYRLGKIKGQARALVACNGIRRAIEYHAAINAYIIELKLPFRAILAFSGEFDYGGKVITEASVNDFPSSKIAEKLQEEPYRLLIVADKFLTGYDEPLLHTMYVDKPLAGIKAVQTLSRLNRTADNLAKTDTFVLDFFNDPEVILAAFQPFYQTTVLSEETDPNKLHDLQSDLDGYQVYDQNQIDTLVKRYLDGADVSLIHPTLDVCVEAYKALDEDGQVAFKGKAKAFVRTYNFLGSILPFPFPEWEKRSIFLNFLIPKLPAPIEDDPTRGIVETIDMDSYRVEALKTMKIGLADEAGEVDPAVIGIGGRIEPEIDRLSRIIASFNDLFGGIDWTDTDKVATFISEALPAEVALDQAYQNAIVQGDRENARLEHDRAIKDAIIKFASIHADVFKQYSDNDQFRAWVQETSFNTSFPKPTAAP